MIFQLDREDDQLYVLFRPDSAVKGSVAKTVRFTDQVMADLDADGRLIGLDVSEASKVLGVSDLEQLAIGVAVGGGRRQKS